jgi:hypothetical protein
MAHIRFVDRSKGTVRKLPAANARQAKQLFDYAVSCATADMRIELVMADQIVKTHWVDFVETIPSVREMPRYT